MRRIVIVGRKTAVQAHAERYACFDDAAITGVVERGGKVDIDAPGYDSLATALDAHKVDAVDVCGPGAASTDALDTALKAGIPVRCDPPFALDERRFDRLVSRASNTSGWLMAHSPHRFSRLYERLRSSVETGGIGAIGVARIKRTAPFDGPGWNVSYTGIDTTHENTLCAILAHDFDVLDWTFGTVDRVFVRKRSGGRYDHVHALLSFRNGGRATIETTWGNDVTPSPRVEVEYSGNHGRIDFSERDASTALRGEECSLTVDPIEDDCRGRLLRTFVDRLRGVERPPSDVAPESASQIAIAARRSIDKRVPVSLTEGET